MNQEIKQRIDQIKKAMIPIGYKNTKVGVIPIDWGCTHLNQIAEEITNRVGNGKYETLSISAGIGFVNQAKKFGKELSGKQYEKYIVLKRGDFSYNKGNSKAYPQGCIYRLKNRDTAAVPNVFESFTVNNGDANYYEQIFISGFLNKQLSKKINHGVRDDGLLNLTGKDFYNCYIPCPPREEQQKIAEILMQCDKIIELYVQEIEELKKLKKAYLRKMFPQKGQNVPELRFAGFTEPWEQRKVGDLIEDYIEKTTIQNQYPVLTSSQQQGIVLQEEYFADRQVTTSDNIGYYVLPYGYFTYRSRSDTDVFVFNRNTLINKGIISYYYPVFHPKNCDSNFLLRRLNHGVRKQLSMAAEGTGQKVLAHNKFKNMVVDVPKFNEQKKIGLLFERLDHLITLHQRKLEEQKNQKKSLMQLLLTGIVRIKI